MKLITFIAFANPKTLRTLKKKVTVYIIGKRLNLVSLLVIKTQQTIPISFAMYTLLRMLGGQTPPPL